MDIQAERLVLETSQLPTFRWHNALLLAWFVPSALEPTTEINFPSPVREPSLSNRNYVTRARVGIEKGMEAAPRLPPIPPSAAVRWTSRPLKRSVLLASPARHFKRVDAFFAGGRESIRPTVNIGIGGKKTTGVPNKFVSYYPEKRGVTGRKSGRGLFSLMLRLCGGSSTRNDLARPLAQQK